MSIYSRMVSRFLFPIHEWIKGHTTFVKLNELEKTQWYEHNKIASVQSQKLAEFLCYINRHNPYYQKLFKTLGLNSSDLKNTQVLERIPVLDKATIRTNQSNFLSDNSVDPVFMSTSGSSGTPLKFAMGNDRVSHDVAAKLRATRWWGVDIGDKEAVIWASNIELSGQGLVKSLRDKLVRSKLFPAQNLNEEGLENLFLSIQHYQPAMIYAYPSIMTLLAEFAKRRGLSYSSNKLKVIFCTAEKLYQHQRETIERVFATPVANGYGSRDAGFIAHQCPHGQLHVSEEDIIVEVLNKDRSPCQPGEIGELIVTNLSTRDFPMLRYNTGDLAILEDKPCGCGRGLISLADVVGRSNDTLLSTEGDTLHGAYIGNVIRQDEAICQFQLIQQSATDFELNIVCYPEQQINLNNLRLELTKLLGSKADIQIMLVNNIEAQQTGKYKYVINNYQPKS